MNRRGFLTGLLGVAAGLALPPAPERRFWALDASMLGQGARASRLVIDEAAIVRGRWHDDFDREMMRQRKLLHGALLHGHDVPAAPIITYRSDQGFLWFAAPELPGMAPETASTSALLDRLKI